MAQLADSFLLASGKLQTLCYKADIEAALRTPKFGGFQLLGLNDFPGQGTALVGSLDVFWEEKGYVSPEEYSRFCNAEREDLILEELEGYGMKINEVSDEARQEMADVAQPAAIESVAADIGQDKVDEYLADVEAVLSEISDY